MTSEHHFELLLTEKTVQTLKFRHNAKHMEHKQENILKLSS